MLKTNISQRNISFEVAPALLVGQLPQDSVVLSNEMPTKLLSNKQMEDFAKYPQNLE